LLRRWSLYFHAGDHRFESGWGYLSEGEIVDALLDVWGDYRESPVF